MKIDIVMEKNNSIKKNFIMNCILVVPNLLFPLITLPYASRILLPYGIGQITFATSVVSYFSLFTTMGIPVYGVRIVAQSKDNKQQMSANVLEILLINIFMIVIVGSIFVLFVIKSNSSINGRLIYLILGTTLWAEPLGIEWLYKGLEKYAYMAIRSLVFKTLALFGIFIFVKSPDDSLQYAFFSVLGTLGSNIFNLISVHKHICKVQINIKNCLIHIKPIIIFFSMNIATTIYTNMDNIMLGIISGAAEVGYYSIAVKIRSLLLSVVTALGIVLLPRTSYYVEKEMYVQFYQVCQKALNFICIISFPIVVFFTITADSCVEILAGNNFSSSVTALIIILPTVILVGFSNLTGIQMLVPLHKENVVLKSVVCGALTDFLLNIIMLPLFKANGAAASTLISEVIVLFIQIKAFDKKTIKKLFSRKWRFSILAVIVSAMFCIFIIHSIENVYINFIISGIIFWCSYFVILFIGKEPAIIEVTRFLKGLIIKYYKK